MKKNRIISSIITFCIIIGIGGFFSYVHISKLYGEHTKLWEYRRLQPDIIPSAQSLEILSVWHNTTYASILWIQLIQFIGDNIRASRYLDFTHKIIKNIEALHPRFARPYELDLLLLPMVYSDDDTPTGQKNLARLREWLSYYEETIPKICDMRKVQVIDSMAFGEELWSRDDLRNPCLSAYIPYYLASRYDSDIIDKSQASRYYKIASMHSDGPMASRFLGILAFSNTWNYHDWALTFSLIAAEWYDEEPYMCRDLAVSLVKDLSNKIPWTDDWLSELQKKEQLLQSPKDTSNPLALHSSCFDSLERGIKQIYIWYVTDIAEGIDDVTTIEELIELWKIRNIPTIQSQKDFTMVKKNGKWRYIVKMDQK